MDQKKVYSSKKALYLLLCGVLGMILFVIIQQAAMLLFIMLLMNQLSASDFNQAQWGMFDSATYVVAMFFGSWYGIWLGLHWYEIVYEQGRKGLFHAFIGRLANGQNKTPSTSAPAIEKTPIIARPQPQAKPAAKPQQVATKPASAGWRFEDLARLRPVTARPPRTEPIATSTNWTKKVSVKPPVSGPTKKTVDNKPLAKPTLVRRKVTAKANPESV